MLVRKKLKTRNPGVFSSDIEELMFLKIKKYETKNFFNASRIIIRLWNAQLFLFVNIFCCQKTGINLLSDDIKNVSSSTYHKKLKLRDFSFSFKHIHLWTNFYKDFFEDENFSKNEVWPQRSHKVILKLKKKKNPGNIIC